MNRTKANFRALREMLGMSQQDVADEADVAILTIKRWEKPGNGLEPPEDVWAFLLDCVKAQAQVADTAVNAATVTDGTVQITYYRTQQQFEEYGREDGPFGMANANARLVASRLMDMGREVEFCYPDDAANIYHSADK